MTPASFRVEEGGRGRLVLVLAGDWSARTLGRTPRKLVSALKERQFTAVDISGLGRFDTTGALTLVQANGTQGCTQGCGWVHSPPHHVA